MKSKQRVLHGTTDLSAKVNDYRSSASAFNYTAGQYLYIASEVPFNNIWIDTGTVNAVATVVDVDTWVASGWQSAVDITDETAVAGVSLAQDGRVSWTNDITLGTGWDIAQKSTDVTGLSGTSIYNMYWARLSWDASVTNGTTIKYIGQKFSTDTDLYDYYPDLNNSDIKEAFEAGKTDWQRQHYIAAEKIVNELTSRRIIRSRGQIVDWYEFRESACHKVAELIYSGLGQAFREDVTAARAAFKETMNKGTFRVDTDTDGELSEGEKRSSTIYATRG